MADGMLGYGTGVRIGRGVGPTDWKTLDLIGDIDMPESQADDVDVTHMKSPGRRKQYIQGLIDSGEVSIPMNYIPGSDTDDLLHELLASGEIVLIEFSIPTAGTTPIEPETYSGYLRGYARSLPVEDKATATATFRLSERVVSG